MSAVSNNERKRNIRAIPLCCERTTSNNKISSFVLYHICSKCVWTVIISCTFCSATNIFCTSSSFIHLWTILVWSTVRHTLYTYGLCMAVLMFVCENVSRFYYFIAVWMAFAFWGWLEHIILDYSEYGSIKHHIDRGKHTHTLNIHSATSRSSKYNTRMLYVVSLICYTISCVCICVLLDVLCLRTKKNKEWYFRLYFVGLCFEGWLIFFFV